MQRETIIVLETVIDHITGEEIGNAVEQLNAMPQVLDAVYIPALGKKNRPCGLMQVLCRPEDEDHAVTALFRHTHALGVRRQELERYTLPRRSDCVEIEGKPVRAKIHQLEGQSYVRPEAEELARLARQRNIGMPALRLEIKK